MEQTIRVPIRARYKVIDGEPILQEAEYADVADHRRNVAKSLSCFSEKN